MTENATMLNEGLTVASAAPAETIKQRGLLANRNLRLLWAGESVSLLGDQFYMVALPWLVLQLTSSALAVGTILAVAGIPRALLMVIGGVFTDRMSPRTLMLGSNAARIVITGLLTLLVVTNGLQVWMLYIFSLAFGIVDAFFHPAYMAIIPMIVEDEDIGGANTAVQGTGLIVSAVGPGIGGVLVKTLGIASSFFLDTVSFIVATLTLVWMHPAKVAKHDAEKKPFNLLADLREGVDYIVGDKVLRIMMLIVMALNFLFTGPMLVGPAVMARERFAEGSVALGILLSAMGAGSLIGMVLAGILKPSRLGVVTLATVAVSGVTIVMAGFTTSLWSTALLFGVTGASSGFSNLLLLTWLQRRVSKEMMGRVMSFTMLASMGLMPIASAVGGLVAEYSLTTLFVVNGVLLVVTVALSMLNTEVRNMRA